jgi:hypothetical protein
LYLEKLDECIINNILSFDKVPQSYHQFIIMFSKKHDVIKAIRVSFFSYFKKLDEDIIPREIYS